jgi:hypothetical protein
MGAALESTVIVLFCEKLTVFFCDKRSQGQRRDLSVSPARLSVE